MPAWLKAGAGHPLRALLGATFLLIGVGALVVSTAFDEPAVMKRLGPNLPVNEGALDPRDVSSHNSPTLIRNPRAADNLVVANRIDAPALACAVHVSLDAGRTWSQSAIPAPPGERVCHAPDAVFRSDGTLVLSFVTLRGPGAVPNAVWVTSSKDGGRTFAKPARVLDRLAYQVRLTADPKAPKRLYLTWVQASQVSRFALKGFTDPVNPIRVARSDDGGVEWSPPQRVNGPSHARAVAPAPNVGPNGELYVLYVDLGGDLLDYLGAHGGMAGAPYRGSWKLVLATSPDQGRSWTESVVEDRLVPSERVSVFTPPFPALAVDRSSGRVYASYYDARLGDKDVWVWAQKGRAERWGSPTRVSDGPPRDGSDQYLAQLAVAPDGRLDVLYYDGRSRGEGGATDVSLQSSSDGGESFGGTVRISTAPFDSRGGRTRGRELSSLGSRLGLLSTSSRAFAIWADNRAATKEAKKQDLARAVVAFSDPERLPKGLEYLLRFGGLAIALTGLALVGIWVLSGGPAALRHSRA